MSESVTSLSHLKGAATCQAIRIPTITANIAAIFGATSFAVTTCLLKDCPALFEEYLGDHIGEKVFLKAVDRMAPYRAATYLKISRTR